MAYNYQQMPNYYGQQQPMFPNGNASPDMLNQYKGQYQQPMQPQQMPQQMMPAPIPSNDISKIFSSYFVGFLHILLKIESIWAISLLLYPSVFQDNLGTNL